MPKFTESWSDDELLPLLRRHVEEGHTIARLSRETGVPRQTLSRRFRRMRDRDLLRKAHTKASLLGEAERAVEAEAPPPPGRLLPQASDRPPARYNPRSKQRGTRIRAFTTPMPGAAAMGLTHSFTDSASDRGPDYRDWLDEKDAAAKARAYASPDPRGRYFLRDGRGVIECRRSVAEEKGLTPIPDDPGDAQRTSERLRLEAGVDAPA